MAEPATTPKDKANVVALVFNYKVNCADSAPLSKAVQDNWDRLVKERAYTDKQLNEAIGEVTKFAMMMGGKNWCAAVEEKLGAR